MNRKRAFGFIITAALLLFVGSCQERPPNSTTTSAGDTPAEEELTPVAKDYDALFARLAVGMKRSEVEDLLGPPTGRPACAMGERLVGFRDVDLPPLDQLPTPQPERLWWYNGGDLCIYVEFTGDQIWRTKLFGPDGLERRKGG